MKKPQWITIAVAIILTVSIYVFGRRTPEHKVVAAEVHTESDGHNHADVAPLTIDSILAIAKKQLNPEQVNRISLLESSITRGDVKNQQMQVYHQLSHFWKDTMQFFPPYAWYEAEAARLENSEKTLTFAARLFLENLQQEENPGLRQWGALQAKDLLERSLKINPDNDSTKVGLGSTYLFGNVSSNPMEGIAMIRSVAEKDSTNVYAQLTLVKGSIISGQFDKAVSRLKIVNRIQPDNIEAILMLADVLERTKENKAAAGWYRKSLQYIKRADVRGDIEKRIEELEK